MKFRRLQPTRKATTFNGAALPSASRACSRLVAQRLEDTPYRARNPAEVSPVIPTAAASRRASVRMSLSSRSQPAHGFVRAP